MKFNIFFPKSTNFRVFSIFLISFICLFSCKNSSLNNQNSTKQINKMIINQNLPTKPLNIDQIIQEKKVQINKQKAYQFFVDSFTLEEKIAQLFIQSLGGNKNFIPDETLSNGKTLIPGAYIFFGFNIAETQKDLINFTNSINDFCVKNYLVPPFLSIDHEGGIVNRLRKINAPLPSCKDIANNFSLQEAQKIYELQALQLKNLGFHMNIAPVVEVLSNQNKDFLEDRSFGSINQVLDYSSTCVDSYEKNNILTVIKHFPGNTNTDPHSGLPIINLSKEDVFNNLSPFKKLITEQKASCVLMSHAIVSSVDKGIPSCLSKKWVHDILRKDFGFNGLIISDDIFMAALSKNGFDTKKAVIMAIEAGVDCIMITQRSIKYPVNVLLEEAQNNNEFLQKIDIAFNRIIDFKIKNGLLSYIQNQDGSFTICANQNDDAKVLLQNFNKAKEENLSFYKAKNEK